MLKVLFATKVAFGDTVDQDQTVQTCNLWFLTDTVGFAEKPRHVHTISGQEIPVIWVLFYNEIVHWVYLALQLCTTQTQILMTFTKEAFSKHCGKRRKCHFLTMFCALFKTSFKFSVTVILSSATAFKLE